jgi:hypothetical protein
MTGIVTGILVAGLMAAAAYLLAQQHRLRLRLQALEDQLAAFGIRPAGAVGPTAPGSPMPAPAGTPGHGHVTVRPGHLATSASR